jgi:hypothetical protein
VEETTGCKNLEEVDAMIQYNGPMLRCTIGVAENLQLRRFSDELL